AARCAAVGAGAVVDTGDNAEPHLAEAFDGLRAGLAIGAGNPDALRLGKLAFQFAAALGQFQEPLAAVLRPTMLDDKAAAHELAQDPVEALFCDPQDRQQIADGDVRMAPDKMHDPVVRPPKAVLLKDCVGLGREVAIGEKQQLDALPHLFLAPERRLAGDCGGRWGGRRFYVSHVDLSAQPSVQSEGLVRHKVPRRKPILKLGRRSNLWTGFVYSADRSVYYQDSHHEKQLWQLSLSL